MARNFGHTQDDKLSLPQVKNQVQNPREASITLQVCNVSLVLFVVY
jgi:hypothetical protein